jgi:hypothetical protein
MSFHALRRYAPPAIAVLLLSMCSGPLEPSDLAGTWGGEHVEVTFDTLGAGTLQYDCAHGRIEAPITIDRAGAIVASGEHVREHGGPEREGEPPDAHPATYAGELRGDRLTFTVTLTDDGAVLGPFTVRRGRPAEVLRCL